MGKSIYGRCFFSNYGDRNETGNIIVAVDYSLKEYIGSICIFDKMGKPFSCSDKSSFTQYKSYMDYMNHLTSLYFTEYPINSEYGYTYEDYYHTLIYGGATF